MRTDAKIGFAIGAVLLAVLTVYAIVVPKHKKTTSNTVTLVSPPPQPAPAPAPVASDSSTPPTPPIAAADSPSSTLGKESGTPQIAGNSPANPTGNSPLTDSSTGTGGMGAFHPVVPPELPKVDDSKPGNLVDGVYTPSGSGSRHGSSAKTPRTPAPAPDDSAQVNTAGDRTYEIKPGQTLSKIAYEVYGNSRFWVAIQRENRGLDSNHLKVGTKINLPDITPLQPGPVTLTDVEAPIKPSHSQAVRTDGHTYIVQSGDSLYGIAKKVLGSGRRADTLYALNKDLIGADKSKLKLGMVLRLPEPAPAALADRRPLR